jgi:GNAT superfamily N-acetyltransferase
MTRAEHTVSRLLEDDELDWSDDPSDMDASVGKLDIRGLLSQRGYSTLPVYGNNDKHWRKSINIEKGTDVVVNVIDGYSLAAPRRKVWAITVYVTHDESRTAYYGELKDDEAEVNYFISNVERWIASAARQVKTNPRREDYDDHMFLELVLSYDLPKKVHAFRRKREAFWKDGQIEESEEELDWAPEKSDPDDANISIEPPKKISIFGRRWWRRTSGTTYYSAEIWVDDKFVHKIEHGSGYGDQYIHAAFGWLEQAGYIERKGREPYWSIAERYGFKLIVDVDDVKRERDM